MSIKANNEHLERILVGQARLIEEVQGILEDEQHYDDLLRATVKTSCGERINRIPGLDASRVFRTEEIKDLCVTYRLRFLDAKWFKGEIPVQAIHAIRRLEAMSGGPVLGYKVLAPARRFTLSDCEADPLLFIPLEGGSYYLVHRWGHELTPLRKVLYWWMRSPRELVAALLLLALLLTAVIPTRLIGTHPDATWWGPHRLLFLFWSIMVTASFVVFGWLAFFGRFSVDAWNSRHFN